MEALEANASSRRALVELAGEPSPEAWAAVGVAAVVSVMARGGRSRGVWVLV